MEQIITDVFATAGETHLEGGPRGSRGPAAGVAENGELVVEMLPPEETGVQIGSRDYIGFMLDRVPPIPEAERFSFSFARGGGAPTIQLQGPSIDDSKRFLRSFRRSWLGMKAFTTLKTLSNDRLKN